MKHPSFLLNRIFQASLPIFLLITFLSCKKITNPAPPAGDLKLEISEERSLQSTCSEMFLTAHADQTGRPYLYVAAKEGGLKIFALSGSLIPVAQIPISQLNGLHVMNISQSGNDLYLALGNHFGTAIQAPGLAIIDVTDPLNPLVRSTWQDISQTGGTGIIETQGNFAYLGAMGNGMIIFDISNKAAPRVLSVFKPDLNFPDPNPDPKKYNARGLAILGDLVYLCFDAGGLRVINIADKVHPFEAGRYANPQMNGKPRAYNNVVIDGMTAYLAVDYCGMEAVDISRPSSINLLSWWNPWNCQASPMNWFSSNGHTNEIVMDREKHLLFMASGKSDLQVVNVSDPAKPQFSKEYGGVNNQVGTWGVSIRDNKIYLAYVCSVIPFSSNWTGVKVLGYALR